MIRRPSIALLVIGLVFTGVGLSAQSRVDTKAIAGDSVKRASRTSAIRELREDLESIVSTSELSGSTIGYSVVSAESGEMIAQYHADKFFTPASTEKLFTTAAALSILGPEFRFKTTLYLDGIIHPKGEFEGNIIVRGGGDPTWCSLYGRQSEDILARWADVLDSLGIRSIRGSIIGDDDVFDDISYPKGWQWDDLVYSYAAQVNGLSVADNSVRIVIVPPHAVTDLPNVRLKPQTDYVRVIPALRILDSSGVTDVIPTRDFHSNTIDLVGSLSTKGATDSIRLHVSVDNPTLYSLSLFKDALVKRGIRVRSTLIDIDDWADPIDYDKLRKIDDVSSPPLSSIIATINKHSHNLGAEALLKTLGVHVSGEGSFERGCEVIRLWTQREGIATNALTIVDGSGLSRLNLCTPSHLTSLLLAMHRSPNADVFIRSLAIPGEEGSMRRRLSGTRAVSAVKAKTGSMNNVNTLSGYITTREGEPFAFAIMLNGVVVPPAMAQNVQDLICMRLSSFSRGR